MAELLADLTATGGRTTANQPRAKAGRAGQPDAGELRKRRSAASSKARDEARRHLRKQQLSTAAELEALSLAAAESDGEMKSDEEEEYVYDV